MAALRRIAAQLLELLTSERLRKNRWFQRAMALSWLLLSVALVLWFGGRLQRSWEDLINYPFTWRVGYIIPTLASYFVAQAYPTATWHAIMRRLHPGVAWKSDLTAYSYSFFLSGLPGGFWSVFSLVYFYGELGVQRARVVLAVVLEQVSLLLAGVLVCLLVAPFALPTLPGEWIFIGIAALLPLLLLASPLTWRWLLQILSRLKPLAALSGTTVPFRSMLLWITLQVGLMVWSSVLNYLAINIMLPLPIDYMPQIVASWAIIVVFSNLAYWVPGTAGFQLALTTLVFGTFLPLPVVLCLMLMLRVARITGSCLWAIAAFLAADAPAMLRRRLARR